MIPVDPVDTAIQARKYLCRVYRWQQTRLVGRAQAPPSKEDCKNGRCTEVDPSASLVVTLHTTKKFERIREEFSIKEDNAHREAEVNLFHMQTENRRKSRPNRT